MSWKSRPLKELCIIKPPKKDSKSLLAEEDMVSFVPMKNLGIECKSLYLDEDRQLKDVSGSYTYFANNDVLLAKITPCFENGKLGIAHGLTNGIGFGSSEFIVFRGKGQIEPEYLYYFLLQDSFRKNGTKVMTGAVGHKRVPKEFIENTLIPCPPLPEQKRIVAILDEAYASINQAIANTERNLVNARELFESSLRSVFSNQQEGWFESKAGDQFTLQRGFDITKKEQVAGDIPVVSSGGIKSFHNKSMANAPGVVIGRKGTLGKAYYLEEDYWPHDTTLWVKDFKNNTPKLVYYFLKQLDVKHLDSGAANPALNRKYVHSILTFWPEKDMHQMIVERFDSLSVEVEKLISLYSHKLSLLVELKQSILQKAFSGELTESYVKEKTQT